MDSAPRRPLIAWSAVVLVLVAAHDGTHLLDDGLETPLGQLAAVSVPQWLFLGFAMAVVVRGDAVRSRLAALLLGASVAAGFAVVHLLPIAPTALWQLRPSVVSWVLVWAATAAGLVLAARAWRSPRNGPIPTRGRIPRARAG